MAVDPNPTDKGPNPPPTIGGLPTLPQNDFLNGTFLSVDKPESLKYPQTMNSGQDRLFITQLKYVRTDIVQQESDYTKLSAVGYVTLPMPNDITETNSVGWGEDSISNVARLAMPGLIGAASDVASGGIAGSVQKAFDTVRATVLGSSTRIPQFLATKAAASVVQKFGVTVNPEAYISRATGAAINPNLELLFNGPKLRQFGFQFKLTPRNGSEATQIRKILRFFKQGMSPKRASSIESSFFLGAPNVFKIEFKSGGNQLKSIGRIKTCALVSFSANYTPDGFYAAYQDSAAGGSQPIAVTIQLGFTELTPVFSDEYDTPNDEVGPNNFKYTTPDLPNTPASGNERSGYSGPPTPGTETATPPSQQPQLGLGVPPPY